MFNYTQKYAVIDKHLGETPLQAIERFRAMHQIPETVPLAYAGRLDPMAEGLLIVLIGDECKRQERYHSFDKEYQFEILLGVGSDTGDVLGLVKLDEYIPSYAPDTIKQALHTLRGDISLPFPHFSARTVKGKPLHTWTLEGRLGEIEIPVKHSRVYTLTSNEIQLISAEDLHANVIAKINTIPPVTDPRKALGADFRRDDVRKTWNTVYQANPEAQYQIVSCTCSASSGTYMRSLAEEIGKRLGTHALAYSIRRTEIGKYVPIFPKTFGFWVNRFSKLRRK